MYALAIFQSEWCAFNNWKHVMIFDGSNHMIRKSDYCQIRCYQNIVFSESCDCLTNILIWLLKCFDNLIKVHSRLFICRVNLKYIQRKEG